MPIGNDLTGKKFGRLTVIRKIDNCAQLNGKRHSMWLCKCDCGNIKPYFACNLKRGTSTSCGCFQKEQLSKRRTLHGGWANREKLFGVWCGIRKRCNCKTDSHYADYGGRGISICSDWDDYNEFRSWALSNGYVDGLSIDRINTNGNYEPSNCRWATNRDQQNNRRSCIYITFNNETHTLKEWSRIRNINYSTIYQRYKLGWSTEELLGYIARKPKNDKDLHRIWYKRSEHQHTGEN